MKKKTLIAILVIVVALSLCLCACTKQDSQPKEVTVYIVNSDNTQLAVYQKTVTLSTVAELLDFLAEEEDSTFGYSASKSAYGLFINSITVSTDTQTWQSVGLFPDTNNAEYCAFYHTLDDVKYADYTVSTFTYKDTEFYSSGTGASQTPLVDGGCYLYTIRTYS